MSVSRIIVRILGFICTYAFCEVIYPPAPVPPSDILPDSSNSIARQFDFDNVIQSTSPTVTLQKHWALPSDTLQDLEKETVQVNGYFSRTVRGRRISVFEGLPYGKPPVGILRFKDPEPHAFIHNTFDATRMPPVCVQSDVLKFFRVVGEEDCLYLNVYIPSQSGGRTENKYPVMIYLHGGSFNVGSGNYAGPAYLLDKDVILVTVNYRLGPFGFLSTGDDRLPGNVGLKDQAIAINWVYHNIEAFGGNPLQISIWGQSAGGASAHLQLMSTQAKDKIFSAITHSGTAFSHWAFPPVVNRTNKFASILGCSPHSQDLVECLRRIPAETLASSQYDLYEWQQHPNVLFGPVVEHKHQNAFISDSPEFLYKTGQVANVPLMTGVTKDEGDAFSLFTYVSLTGRSLLRNLNKTLPIVLFYPKDDFETTRKIKDYYLSGFEKPTLSAYEALENLGQMMGDLFFYSSFDKSMEYHTKWTTSPAYGYFLSYHGKHGISEKFSIPPSQFGVMHTDDLQYILNSTTYFYPLTPENKDYAIVEYMTTLWTNFATNGIPSLQNVKQRKDILLDVNSSETIWRKFDLTERNVLDINEKLSMIRVPYENRFAFWKSTPYH